MTDSFDREIKNALDTAFTQDGISVIDELMAKTLAAIAKAESDRDSIREDYDRIMSRSPEEETIEEETKEKDTTVVSAEELKKLRRRRVIRIASTVVAAALVAVVGISFFSSIGRKGSVPMGMEMVASDTTAMNSSEAYAEGLKDDSVAEEQYGFADFFDSDDDAIDDSKFAESSDAKAESLYDTRYFEVTKDEEFSGEESEVAAFAGDLEVGTDGLSVEKSADLPMSLATPTPSADALTAVGREGSDVTDAGSSAVLTPQAYIYSYDIIVVPSSEKMDELVAVIDSYSLNGAYTPDDSVVNAQFTYDLNCAVEWYDYEDGGDTYYRYIEIHDNYCLLYSGHVMLMGTDEDDVVYSAYDIEDYESLVAALAAVDGVFFYPANIQ